jgi:ABC-type phosphate/phosphonate transport system permease subunit
VLSIIRNHQEKYKSQRESLTFLIIQTNIFWLFGKLKSTMVQTIFVAAIAALFSTAVAVPTGTTPVKADRVLSAPLEKRTK